MKTQKPWLDSMNLPLPDSELMEISRSWAVPDWERYLRWYQSGQRHVLLPAESYDALCEGRVLEAFEEQGSPRRGIDRKRCGALIKTLPPKEQKVVELYFLEGLTEREIATRLGLTPAGVHWRKKTAIFRLRRGLQGDPLSTQTLLRGLDDDLESDEPSVWDRTLLDPIREDRSYDPTQGKEELRRVRPEALRAAITELTASEQDVVYLRFWCDLPATDIARRMNRGVNAVAELEDVSVFKIKSKIAEIMAHERTKQCL